jgi:signal transduction histidine kinase/ligand-binding sensor domain-containing protein
MALSWASPVTCLAAQAPLPLQYWQHSRWTARDGLPPEGVYQLARTPDGYLWGTSIDAVVRFDGVRFTPVDSTMTSALRPSGSIRPELLSSLTRRTLQFISPAGIAIEYVDGSFRVPAPDNRMSGISRTETPEEDFTWVIQGPERRAHRLQGGRLLPAGFPAGIADTGVLNIVRDTARGIWIGTRSQGLWHVKADRTLRHYPVDGRPLLHDRSGTLWIWSNGVQMLRGERWSNLRFPGRPADLIWGYVARESRDGAIWLGTRGHGVVRYAQGALDQFTERDGLSDAIVHDLLIDPAGDVWVATESGLDRLRLAPFVTLTPGAEMPSNSLMGIVRDADGSIWSGEFGTSGLFSLQGGLVDRSPGPVRMTRHQVVPSYSVGPGARGGLWLARRNTNRLFLYQDGKLVPSAGVRMPPGSRAYRSVNTSDGRIWVILAPAGLGTVERGHFHQVKLRPGSREPQVFAVVPDARDHLWILADGTPALYRVTGGHTVTPIHTGLREEDRPFGLSFRTPDTLWVGGISGIIRITGTRTDHIPLPETITLLRSRTRVFSVEGQHLWMAGEGGILRVSLTELNRVADGATAPVQVRRFDETDGLRSGRITGLNTHPFATAADGRLWFATPAGLAVGDPALITGDTITPVPHADQLTADGRRIRLEEDVTIRPNPGRVEIRYTATGPVDPHRMRLEYQLEGTDRDWIPSGPERLVAYGRLGPGHYRFRVRATNGDGVPSASDAVLAFRILPAWYQTPFFLSFVGLSLAAAVIASIYLIQRSRIRAAHQRMQARYDATLSERTRLARELHDTLLQGFTGITLQLQVVKGSVATSPREAVVSLEQVLTTADATLREARQMVWDMRAPELDQQDLAAALESAARQVIGSRELQLDFRVIGRRRRVDIGLESTALRIGREAVVNAVKHAEATIITITVHYAIAQLVVLVTDNGRGMASATPDIAVQAGHWGLHGMRERAERAGGTLAIASAPGNGTTISLTLPLVTP